MINERRVRVTVEMDMLLLPERIEEILEEEFPEADVSVDVLEEYEEQ